MPLTPPCRCSSTAAGEIEQFAEALHDANLQRRKLGLIKLPRADQLECRLARFAQLGLVTDEVGHFQRQFAMLSCSQDVSGATETKIGLGHGETARVLFQGLQALVGGCVIGFREQEAITLKTSPADAAAQLVQL